MTAEKPHPTLCLSFDHSAEDAVQTYVDLFQSVFGDSAVESTNHFDEYELAELRKVPEITEDIMPAKGVKTLRFRLAGREFYAVNGGHYFGKFNESMSIYVSCETQDEIDALWRELSRDCIEEQPCGWVKDRYGISWQIVPAFVWEVEDGDDRKRAAKMNVAMFGMKKIDIAKLRAAMDA